MNRSAVFEIFLVFIFVIDVAESAAPNTLDNAAFGDLHYDNYVYTANIRTVLLYKKGFEMSSPLMELNSSSHLVLSFDDLDADVKDYYYTFVHCDANWTPSDIVQSDYINGYYQARIYDHTFSVNTQQHYTHYNLTFPTEDLKPTISGNYLLKVFLDGDEGNIVLTRRFMVIENKVTINGAVHRSNIVEDRDRNQKIDFTILCKNFPINIPDDVFTIITQNDRLDNAIEGLKPAFVHDNILEYTFDEGNSFTAGNEFRYFDIRTLHLNTERINKITRDSTGHYDVQLLPDKSRGNAYYSLEEDMNGRFKISIESEQGDSAALDADYVKVHFKLLYEYPEQDAAFYIMGAMTDWTFKPEARLQYNYGERVYEGAMYLKQGYYNYEYVYLKNGEKIGNETILEGSHFETENDYTIYVYYRPFSARYDRLIGIKRLNSTNTAGK